MAYSIICLVSLKARVYGENQQFQALILSWYKTACDQLEDIVSIYLGDDLSNASNLGLSGALFLMAELIIIVDTFRSTLCGLGFCCLSYVSFFSLGMGPGAWLVPSKCIQTIFVPRQQLLLFAIGLWPW